MKALFILVLACAVFGTAGYFTYRLFILPEQALKQEKLLPPPPPPPDTTIPEFQKCVAIYKAGKLQPARNAFYAFIEQYPQSSKHKEAKDMLGNINTQIFLTPFPTPEKEVYVVKKGDVVDRVARHTKTTGELLVRVNNLRATSNRGVILQIGQTLLIPTFDLSVVISRKEDRVIVLNKGRFFKWYPILAWPPSLAKKTADGKPAPPMPKQAAKVSDKRAWYEGAPITYADKGYAEATHWIYTGIGGATLHSEADEKSQNRPPGGGIVLSPQACQELAALLRKGDPVTLE